MRVFSGENKDAAEIKYLMEKHKQQMTARELSAFKTTGRTKDGRKFSISSIEGIDNVVVEEASKKKPLSEFSLPKTLRERAMIWIGATRFTEDVFRNLSQLWGSKVRPEATLPRDLDEYTLVFIPALSRALTEDELDRLLAWKTRVSGKIIFCLGTTSLARILLPLDTTVADDNAVTYTNAALLALASPLRFSVMYSTLLHYMTASSSAIKGTRYSNLVAASGYSGVTSSARFNGSNVNNLILDGGTYSVDVADSERLLVAMTTDEVGSTVSVPMVYSGVSPVFYRGYSNIPFKIASYDYEDVESWMYDACALELETPIWWKLSGSEYENFTNDARVLTTLEKYISPYYVEPASWSYLPTIAFCDNVMLFATGNRWFSDSLVLNSSYGNARFILQLLLEPWQDSDDFFRTGPFALSCSVSEGDLFDFVITY